MRQVTELLHQSTGAVRVALGETEQGLAKLDRQLKRFPEREPAVPPPAAPEPPRKPRAQAPRAAAKAESKSRPEGLLELLERVLGR